MGSKVGGLLVLILLCTGGYIVWHHYREQKMEYSGEVTCQGCMTPEEQARFDKENHGETADGQSEHKARTAAEDAKAGFVYPAAQTNATATAGTTTAATGTQVYPATAPTGQAAPMAQPTTSAAGPMPAMDSQSANAPNGMRFAGSGNYQWYRQGNLTWRLDTTSGRSCIIYATMEEWQKQIVYSHGCGHTA